MMYALELNVMPFFTVGWAWKKLIQHLCIFAVALGMQVQFPDAAGGMMLLHVFAETYFAAFLLVRPNDAFVYFAEDDDFLRVFSGKQHQHTCGKISALVRILSEEREGGSFLDIRVYIYIRYIQLFKFIGKGRGVSAGQWGQTTHRRASFPRYCGLPGEGAVIVRVVVPQLHGDVEIRVGGLALVYAAFHFGPIFSGFVLG